MRGDAYLPDLKEVQKAANALNLRLTQRQAERLLRACSPKLLHAMRETTREVIQEEVEKYLFDQEDKELA